MTRVPRPLLIALLLAYALAFQGSRGLWEPDEGRYTDIATQMLRSGEYMVPALNDEHPHFAKPPLTYWTIAGGVSLLGWNEWGVRLPNALAYVATALLVGLLGSWLLPGRQGRLAAIVFASLFLPYMAANVVTTDTLLTLWETVAMTGFVGWWRSRGSSPGRWPRIVMWTGFGLAFFTKGPPGLVPLFAIVAFLVVAGRTRDVRRLFYLPGLLLFALIGLTWYTALIATRPELLGYFVKSEFLERIATGARRRNAQWYGWLAVYLPTFFVGALPWSVVLLRRLAGLRRLIDGRWWRDRVATEPAVVLLAIWVIVPLAAFCVARSRLPLYVLPLFVPLALMITRQFVDRRFPSSRFVWLTVAWLAVLAAGRFVGATIKSPRDARPLARAIGATTADPHSEITFVEHHPRWGLSLYTRNEVEMVTFEAAGRWWANSTLDEEIDEREGTTLFIVPEGEIGRFNEVLARRGIRSDRIGAFRDLGFFRLLESDGTPWPDPPRSAGAQEP